MATKDTAKKLLKEIEADDAALRLAVGQALGTSSPKESVVNTFKVVLQMLAEPRKD